MHVSLSMLVRVSRVGNPTRSAVAQAIGDNAWDRARSRAVCGVPCRAILSHERHAGARGSLSRPAAARAKTGTAVGLRDRSDFAQPKRQLRQIISVFQ